MWTHFNKNDEHDLVALEDRTLFKPEKFFEIYACVCATKKHNALQSRKVLCGY